MTNLNKDFKIVAESDEQQAEQAQTDAEASADKWSFSSVTITHPAELAQAEASADWRGNRFCLTDIILLDENGDVISG